ncbi:hypothetical protein ACWEP1_37280, partial [Streptomyces sp. NPDC004285]
MSLYGSLLARPLAALGLVWLLAAPVPAAADACAYASTDSGGSQLVVGGGRGGPPPGGPPRA